MKAAISSFLLLFFIQNAWAGWDKVSPVGASVTQTILLEDNKIIVPTNAGVAISSDGGDTWDIYKDGLTGFAAQVKSVGSNCDVLFAGTVGGTFQSKDGGKTWTQSDEGLGNSIIKVATNFYKFFGKTFTISGGDIFVSTDGGTKWTPSQEGIPANHTAYDMVEVSEILFTNTNLGFFKSTDKGATWTDVNRPKEKEPTAALVEQNGRLIAMTASALHYSDDLGETWFERESHLDTNYSGALRVVNGMVYATSAGQGIAASKDGFDWEDITDGLAGNQKKFISNIHADKNYVYISTFDGIHRSGKGPTKVLEPQLTANMSYQRSENTLILSNLDEVDAITVYTVSGQIIWRQTNPSSTERVFIQKPNELLILQSQTSKGVYTQKIIF